MWAAEKILELVLSSTSTCIGVYFTRSQPSGEMPNSWCPAEKGVEVGQRCWHSQSELGTARLPRRGQERSLCGKYPQLPGSTNLPFAFPTKPWGLQLASKVGRARQLGLRTGHPPCTAHSARLLPPQGPVISLPGGLLAPPRQPDTHVLYLGAPGVLRQPSFRYERGQALVRTARLARGLCRRAARALLAWTPRPSLEEARAWVAAVPVLPPPP